MIGESVVHFSGLRLASAGEWSMSALSFNYFFQCLWASVSVLIAILLWLLARHKSIWSILLLPVGAFAIFHGIVLWWWSTLAVTSTWQYPSLFVWNPWYAAQLKAEALILIAFGFWIGYGCNRGWLKKL